MQDVSLGRPILFCEIAVGGAERSVVALARWLHRRDLPVYLVTYRAHRDLTLEADFPLTVVDLGVRGGVRAKIAALKAHLAARPAGAPKLLGSGYQAALHATLAGVRGFHCLMHDTPSLFSDGPTRGWKGRLRIRLLNLVTGFGLRSGGRTIVTSEYLKRDCAKEFGVTADIARMGGMGAGTGTGTVRTRGRIAPGERLRMLSVCRIEASKRIDWLLNGLAALEREGLSHRVDWRLDLAGSGSLIADLTALAASLGIGERVYFHGFVEDAVLDALYGQADLFLMPALQGYGIPAIESLARGIPVLLHRESGVSDLLLETPWATVLEGGAENTAAALRQAIEGVITARQQSVPQPALPTEDEWAERVARLCDWVPAGSLTEVTR